MDIKVNIKTVAQMRRALVERTEERIYKVDGKNKTMVYIPGFLSKRHMKRLVGAYKDSVLLNNSAEA